MTLLVMLSGALTVGPSDGSLEECGVASGFEGVGAVSLRPKSLEQISARAVLTARAACPKGTPAMLVRDRLDVLFEQKVLTAAWSADSPPHLRLLPQVEILREVWVHHCYWNTDGRVSPLP